MQLQYTDRAEKTKQAFQSRYAGISVYFSKAETLILKNPCSPVKEDMVLSNGIVKTCYKRQVRTDLFSGLIPDPYLYLSLSYTIEQSLIIIIGVYLHNYTA